MITKYNKFNESIKFLLVGPSKEKMGDYWKSLGFDRTFDTPEEFFLYMIDGMKIKEQTKYPNVIFWMNHGKVIIEQNLKINVIMVDTNSIWSVLEKTFGLSYIETQKLIKGVVEEHLNWKGFTPRSTYTATYIKWKNI